MRFSKEAVLRNCEDQKKHIDFFFEPGEGTERHGVSSPYFDVDQVALDFGARLSPLHLERTRGYLRALPLPRTNAGQLPHLLQ